MKLFRLGRRPHLIHLCIEINFEIALKIYSGAATILRRIFLSVSWRTILIEMLLKFRIYVSVTFTLSYKTKVL